MTKLLTTLTPDPINKFWPQFTHSFCRLDHFSAMEKIACYYVTVWLIKSVRKFTPKKFYWGGSISQCIKTFFFVTFAENKLECLFPVSLYSLV